MSSPGASGLESEAASGVDKLIEAIEHQPASLYRAGFGIERRYPSCNFVGIHKFANIERGIQTAIRPGGLARPVGPTNHNDVLAP